MTAPAASAGIDLNLIVALRVLLEEANVTRAGERLRMTRSSMSVTLARLRAVFQDELLIQVGRELELTPLSRRLLPELEVAVPSIEKALGSDELFHPESSRRTFTLMMSDDALGELKPALCDILAAAPGIRIDIEPLPSTLDGADRDLRRADLIVAAPGFGQSAGGEEVLRDTYVCVVDRDHPALRDGVLSLEDFLAHPWAVAEFTHGHLTPIQHRLRELGVHGRPRVTSSSMLAVPTIVAGTELIGIVPSRAAKRLSASTNTVAVPLPIGEVELVLWTNWHLSRVNDVGHIWFREALLSSLRRSAEDAAG